MNDVGVSNWRKLASRLRGEVIVRGDERMVLANKHYAAGRPLPASAALLRCRDVDDVQRCLEYLRETDCPFSVRSGGHCFADLSSSPGAILDLSELKDLRFEGEFVRAGPGIMGGELNSALAARGRGFPTGGCPWVAIGGLSLVGGFGFLGRTYGLVCDRIRCMDVLTADGVIRTCSATLEPDLFWAMRGAGAAGFGIVTALELETIAFPRLLICYGAWRMDQAADLIDWWQHWIRSSSARASIEVGMIGTDHPSEPCFAKLYGVIIGDDAQTAVDLQSLRNSLGSLGDGLRVWRPEMDVAAGYLCGLVDHEGHVAWQPSRPYERCGFHYLRSDLFSRDWDRRSIESCVRQFEHDRRYAQFRELEFIPWGGAYANPNEHACFRHRDAWGMVRHAVMVGAGADASLRSASGEWVDASRATLAPHASGAVYQGYADLRQEDWADAYYGATWQKLQTIKLRYDPSDAFHHPQSIRLP